MPMKVAMCENCRKDRKKCQPKDRKWPERCDRCIKYKYDCSPNCTPRDRKKLEVSDRQQRSIIRRRTEEILEDLDYIRYLVDAIAEEYMAIELNWQFGWSLLPKNTRDLAKCIIGKVAKNVIKEAEDERESLRLRGKRIEAGIIDEMIFQIMHPTIPSASYSYPKGACLDLIDLNQKRLRDRGPSGDISLGRIFTLVKRYDTTVLVSSANHDEELLRLLNKARKIQEGFWARFDNAYAHDYIKSEGEMNDMFDRISEIINWIDPIDLRAILNLSLKEGSRYMHDHILKSRLGGFHSTGYEFIDLEQYRETLSKLNPSLFKVLEKRMNRNQVISQPLQPTAAFDFHDASAYTEDLRMPEANPLFQAPYYDAGIPFNTNELRETFKYSKLGNQAAPEGSYLCKGVDALGVESAYEGVYSEDLEQSKFLLDCTREYYTYK